MPTIESETPRQRTVERFLRAISAGKPDLPAAFIDTFMWKQLLTPQYADEANVLGHCCQHGKILIVITNALEGELHQRKLLSGVRALAGDALLTLPLGRISANQAIHALVRYLARRDELDLDWSRMIREPVRFDSDALGLKGRLDDLKREINDARAQYSGDGKTLVSVMVGIEREIWRGLLWHYAEVLAPYYPRGYERFFYTDYFCDLPFVVLKAYFYADILSQRDIRTQDLIDVHCVAELLPYCTLFVFDRDQHNRFRVLQDRHPHFFAKLSDICCLSSTLKAAEREPRAMLRSFLQYASAA